MFLHGIIQCENTYWQSAGEFATGNYTVLKHITFTSHDLDTQSRSYRQIRNVAELMKLWTRVLTEPINSK